MMVKTISIVIIFFSVIIFYSCESNDATLTDSTPVPDVPQLLCPENSSVITTLQPSFDWIDMPNSTTYRLQVSANALFTNPILDAAGIAVSNYTSTSNILNDSASYFWRVNGINNTDTTGWSNAYNFSTSINSINPTNKVLIEMFTNTSCIPCVEANTYLDEVYELHGVTSNDANVIMLRIHTTLFAGDPFYLYNTTDNQARMTFYPNSAIVNPRTFLLGGFLGNFSASAWTNKINEKLSETRTYAIKLSNSYDSVSRTGSINVKIKQISGAVLSDLVYHVAISENEIAYSAPNGETIFNNTLRDLITPPTGEPFTISPGQTNSYDLNYSIDPVINEEDVEIVVFVQRNNNSGKDVMAVESINLNQLNDCSSF